MEYTEAAAILNKHIFDGDKKSLVEKIAQNPERYIGLFRPTKPRAKLLQNLLQSHEIRFGDAIESIIESILAEAGYEILPKNLKTVNGESLSIDQFFSDGELYFFMEQKVRDDHDSTKKRGQIENFVKKFEILYEKYGEALVGIMYFIDPDLSKNRNYYVERMKELRELYGMEFHLVYGSEFFEMLGMNESWGQIIQWLTQWKDELPDFPEINLDADPEENVKEISSIRPSVWGKLFENDKLWEDGIIQTISSDGVTLRLMLKYFRNQKKTVYSNLADQLEKRLIVYYG